MSKNEAIIRSGYAAAEGGVNDIQTFVSLFTPGGVILDVASGTCGNASTHRQGNAHAVL